MNTSTVVLSQTVDVPLVVSKRTESNRLVATALAVVPRSVVTQVNKMIQSLYKLKFIQIRFLDTNHKEQ